MEALRQPEEGIGVNPKLSEQPPTKGDGGKDTPNLNIARIANAVPVTLYSQWVTM